MLGQVTSNKHVSYGLSTTRVYLKVSLWFMCELVTLARQNSFGCFSFGWAKLCQQLIGTNGLRAYYDYSTVQSGGNAKYSFAFYYKVFNVHNLIYNKYFSI